MKPLNPIINQLLKQRYNSKALLNEYLRPPPMGGGAAAETSAARAAARAAAAEETAAARAARYAGFEPRQTAIDVYLQTTKINPAKSDPAALSKALEELRTQVRAIGPSISAKDAEATKQMLWTTIVKKNPQISEIKNEALQNGLFQIINDYVENPTPLTVTPPSTTPEPQPVKLSVDTGVQASKTDTEMQPETKIDPLAQAIIVSALSSSPRFKPEPLPQPQLSKPQQKFKTATKTAQKEKPKDEEEEEEGFEPKMPKKEEEDFETEVDSTEDPLKQFLQKKSLGDYSSVFLLK